MANETERDYQTMTMQAACALARKHRVEQGRHSVLDRQQVIRSIETYVREHASEHDHGPGVDAQALADDVLWQFEGFDLVDISEAEVRAIVERVVADRQYVTHRLQVLIREHLAEYDHEEAIAIIVRTLKRMQAEAADK